MWILHVDRLLGDAKWCGPLASQCMYSVLQLTPWHTCRLPASWPPWLGWPHASSSDVLQMKLWSVFKPTTSLLYLWRGWLHICLCEDCCWHPTCPPFAITPVMIKYTMLWILMSCMSNMELALKINAHIDAVCLLGWLWSIQLAGLCEGLD